MWSLINLSNSVWIDIETDRYDDSDYRSLVYLRWGYQPGAGCEEIVLERQNYHKEQEAIRGHEALWNRWNIND